MAKSFSLHAVISAVDKVSGPLTSVNRAIARTRKSMADIGGATGKVASSATHAVAGPLAQLSAAGGLAGGFGVSQIVSASAEFEKFTTILETIEGSSEKAKASMAWVSDFAAKTPYQLQEVTDSFVKLKAYGIDPQSGALTAAGDAAAAMGKPLEQAVEALADAMTGENERLKEFGIKATTAGNQIVYRWRENGKAMVATADKTKEDQVQAVVTGIWNSKFQGAMDKLSKTWTGMWSNLQDAAKRFLLSIGDAGFFDAIKGELKNVLDLIDQWGQDGTLKSAAAEISGVLVDALKGVKQALVGIDWRGVIADVKRLWSTVQQVVAAIGGWSNAMIGLFVIMNAGVLVALGQLAGAVFRLGLLFVSGAAAAVRFALGLIFADQIQAFTLAMKSGLPIIAAFNLALSANPIGLVIIAVAALIAAGWALVANWDAVKTWMLDLWDGVKAIWQGGVAFISALLNGDITGAITGLLSLGKAVVAGLQTAFAPLVALVDKVATLAGIKLPKSPETEAVQQAASAVKASGASQAVQQAASPVKGVVAPQGLAAMTASPANQNSAAAPSSASPSLGASLARVEVVGNLLVKFEDAPPGMRVEGGGTNHLGLAFNSDVGYRNMATGIR